MEIINEIGYWKAITHKELFKSLGKGKTYSNFCTKIRLLEKANLVNGVFERKAGKYLTLTRDGATCSVYPYTDYESSSSVIHDLYCTIVIKSLLNCLIFRSGHVLDYRDSLVEPDGILYLIDGDTRYTMAIEVELHQKSKKRVTEKFGKYLDEKSFNNVLYITNKKSLFVAYQKILMGMNKEIIQKIGLCLDWDLSTTIHDYLNAQYWFDGRDKTFCDLFKIGEK